ncbi:NAD(P)-binding protein [Piedraia hortae CBS 480.64]|uniref:NAD(P)-binding protein n=1 Tax=Piedraia hortae CBS 480.64 TaxID=1314780 RepID=A0A6A7C620_9PEZI|nr:NAD(P)-binding protein [Piedraia hortae CBS 480.64]
MHCNNLLTSISAYRSSTPRDTSNTHTQHLISSLGRHCTIHPLDLSSPESVRSCIPTLLSTGVEIDILLNAAGVQSRHAPESFPEEAFLSVLQVNLTSLWLLSRDVGAHMLSRTPPGGSIINIASLLSFQGGINVPAYAASKGGVVTLTRALSNQWAGRGVRVNAIAPGYVATEMNEALQRDETREREILGRVPMGRWGTPEDFGGPVVFLASEASRFVSGEVVVVDGGWMGR